MNEVRNQLKSQTLNDVEVTSFKTVGGRVFPDASTIQDTLDLTQIVNAWASVHVPTYGTSIPSSSNVATTTGDGDIVAPKVGGQEVFRVQMVNIENGGGGEVQVSFEITDQTSSIPVKVPLASGEVTATIGAGATAGYATDFVLDGNSVLSVSVVSGDPSTVSSFAYYSKSVQ